MSYFASIRMRRYQDDILVDMIPLSYNNILTAIDKGLTYLSKSQKKTGEFEMFTSRQPDMAAAVSYPKSPYVTAFVAHTLTTLPESPLTKQMKKRAVAFLQHEQETTGSWNYEGRDQWQVAPDLDSTSCAIAALAQASHHPELSFFALLWQNEATPGGPYYTWLGINDQPDDPHACQVDALVNANILFCCGLLKISLPRTIYYLQQVIRAEAFQSESAASISPHFLIYAISRAYNDGGVTALGSTMPVLQNYIFSKLRLPDAESSIFNLACLAVSLLNLGTPPTLVRPYLIALLTAQQPDGSWPAGAAFSRYPPEYDGGPALTTALVLEGLTKYLNL
jgi:hypothetical protein